MPLYATDGPLPKDTVGFPAEGVYAPNVGTVAQQGGTVSVDNNNQPYAPAIVGGAGTAGTAAGGVLTVQGVASMTPVLTKVVDSAGTNQVGVNADHTLLVTDGGITVATVTAQTAGAAALKTSSGRICKIIVTSTATAAIFLYDSTNAASGTVIGAVPASTAIGTMFSPNIPFTNGIFPAGAVNTPSLTVSYI